MRPSSIRSLPLGWVFTSCLFACVSLRAQQDPSFPDWLVRGAPDPAAIHPHAGQNAGVYVFATGKGVAIWRSDDLGSWTRAGRVFSDDVPAWAKAIIPKADSIWAPDIAYLNGKYHLYYSVSTMGSQRSVIGLAVNTTLDRDSADYRWEDRGLVLESFPDENDFNAIDPALLVDDDGRAYLYWGSYWTGIKATEIDVATGKPNSLPLKYVAVARRAESAPTSIEAPYVVKHDSYYYLFVSWDYCCDREKSTYKIVVGRSRSPLGPFVDERGRNLAQGGGKLVLMGDQRWRGPGHNSVVRFRGKHWLAYHVIDQDAPDKGRVLQVRPMSWRDGWPQAGQPVEHAVARKPRPKTPALVGRWQHLVNDQDHYDIFFEATGEITGTKGRAFWELQGNQLLMKWQDPQAPGGFWIDRVTLSASQSAYSGANQIGATIRGEKRD